jgi:hypothetical protein
VSQNLTGECVFMQEFQVFHKLLIIKNKDYVGVCVSIYTNLLPPYRAGGK